MFSLVITIISIALVAALALATIYFGGSAFNRGSGSAKAVQLVLEGQQVHGAWQLYQADKAAGIRGTNVIDISDLVREEYLSEVPAMYAHGFVDHGVLRDGELISKELCNDLERRAGRDGYTDDADIPAADVEAKDLPGKFGCYKGEGYGAYYKL